MESSRIEPWPDGVEPIVIVLIFHEDQAMSRYSLVPYTRNKSPIASTLPVIRHSFLFSLTNLVSCATSSIKSVLHMEPITT